MNTQWIIGFRNGDYDLKENCFRPGVSSTTLQMPIDYVEFTEDDQSVLDVHNFFIKIFPDQDIRNYFIDISSELFIGGNKRGQVYFWSGNGNNGKSMTQLFFEKMFGPYAVRLPTSLILRKGSPLSPELARTGNGVRWAVIQELDKEDVVDSSTLKELVGNDLVVHDLFEKERREIKPMFKMAVMCNDRPQISYSDKSMWNRIRVIPFESTFTDNAPDTWEEQLKEKRFPKDVHFVEKIPSMIQAFAWVLLNNLKKNQELIEPDRVKYQNV